MRIAFTLHRISLVAVSCSAAGPLAAQGAPAVHSSRGVEALAAIVGTWQSDTANGVAARSECIWTPAHGAVLCDQQITTPTGPHTALNLFTVQAADGRYELYVLNRPGEPMYQVQFTIEGPIWTYGGEAPDADGQFARTINEFSGSDTYTWRQESRANGEEWKTVSQGRSRRIR